MTISVYETQKELLQSQQAQMFVTLLQVILSEYHLIGRRKWYILFMYSRTSSLKDFINKIWSQKKTSALREPILS